MAVKVGVIANDRYSLQQFNTLLGESGCDIVFADVVDNIDWRGDINRVGVEAWVVCVDDHADDQLADWLAEQPATAMLADDSVPPAHSEGYHEWRQRWLLKLQKLRYGDTPPAAWPKQLWLLLASTGGPEAVAEFLAELPRDLDAGFIYLQHSSVAGVPLIHQVLAKRSAVAIDIAKAGQAVQAGRVLMLGARKRLLLNSQGVLEADGRAWAGDFAPSIDQFVCSAVSKVGAVNHCQLGVIVFSGMAGDGADACRFAAQQGAQIWTQSPASCISPYMPNAAAEAATISFSGSPKQLANKLGESLQAKSATEASFERVAS